MWCYSSVISWLLINKISHWLLRRWMPAKPDGIAMTCIIISCVSIVTYHKQHYAPSMLQLFNINAKKNSFYQWMLIPLNILPCVFVHDCLHVPWRFYTLHTMLSLLLCWLEWMNCMLLTSRLDKLIFFYLKHLV